MFWDGNVLHICYVFFSFYIFYFIYLGVFENICIYIQSLTVKKIIYFLQICELTGRNVVIKMMSNIQGCCLRLCAFLSLHIAAGDSNKLLVMSCNWSWC